MINIIKQMREIILTDLVPSNPRLARISLLEMYVLILTFLQEKSKTREPDFKELKTLKAWVGEEKNFLEVLESLEADIDSLTLTKEENTQLD